MLAKTILSLLTFAVAASATLDPATSNTKGKYPSSPSCSATKTSKAIQAAECSHNTRVSGKQTFAVFTQDHQYDRVPGAPYGTCEAYTCEPGTAMKSDSDKWTFFWSNAGEKSGEGAGCIKSPDDGTCGSQHRAIIPAQRLVPVMLTAKSLEPLTEPIEHTKNGKRLVPLRSLDTRVHRARLLVMYAPMKGRLVSGEDVLKTSYPWRFDPNCRFLPKQMPSQAGSRRQGGTRNVVIFQPSCSDVDAKDANAFQEVISCPRPWKADFDAIDRPATWCKIRNGFCYLWIATA
ncbi:hypothetical protein OPT61_g2180 [Boeremia exigua]|uniref:Uncharacterized protein n=1 Tax=Boeremia exigua TaxID=749465 RepID=A0ACC2IMF2_9PLEO|nr:hypothetical protein OPT61_g2180 [Boeremia exigua]